MDRMLEGTEVVKKKKTSHRGECVWEEKLIVLEHYLYLSAASFSSQKM